MKPNRAKIVAERKALKKQNLNEAKEHFPHKVKVEGDTLEIKQWLIRNRFRSYKMKGLDADYFTKDHVTFFFREKDKMVQFLLSLK